jgi:hypothetical protein
MQSPNNLKVFGSTKTKGPEQDSQYLREEYFSFYNNYMILRNCKY